MRKEIALGLSAFTVFSGAVVDAINHPSDCTGSINWAGYDSTESSFNSQLASCILPDGSVLIMFRNGTSAVLVNLSSPENVKMFDENSAIAYRICDNMYISQRVDKQTGKITTLRNEYVGPQGKEDDRCGY
ncbi:MAG: hypothetical protein US96_C0007G0003 [Candidatus Woesebacteria bacterium GW2011_GWB1_38_5b]|uniref:Uncharacterized protein n=1 Tax=Candidatus Woesebacteria bacterium GW2011_GWB1_38_5b TaxID=1618569 RepID=A0A0G0KJH4_9BACT|nr:MAG: hypothetical protein US96_C0007G0003 [Candidatus Woesebacteria bacterium GW2011_GWB1_38_5b]